MLSEAMATAHPSTLSRGQRFGRLLPFFAGAMLLAGVVAVIGTRIAPSGTGRAEAPLRQEASQVIAPLGEHVAFSAEQKAIISRFVHAAVMREDMAAAWSMVTPKVRFETTKAEWLHGDARIVPYPKGGIAPGLKIDYSTATEAKVELALFPTDANAADPTVFDLFFAKHMGRWKIDGWTPHAVSGVRKS